MCVLSKLVEITFLQYKIVITLLRLSNLNKFCSFSIVIFQLKSFPFEKSTLLTWIDTQPCHRTLDTQVICRQECMFGEENSPECNYTTIAIAAHCKQSHTHYNTLIIRCYVTINFILKNPVCRVIGMISLTFTSIRLQITFSKI